MAHLRSLASAMFLMSIPITLASCGASNQPAAQPDDRASDESAIRAIDADWVKAVAAKDVQRITSYYADGASLFAPGAPLAEDLAYEIGDYQMTTNDKKGKPQEVKAKYVTVWAKQPDGGWKVLVDSPTTTQ